MAISSSFNRHTQRHSPLDVSKSRLRIVSSNLNNHDFGRHHQRCDRSFLAVAATTTARLTPYHRLLLTEASVQRRCLKLAMAEIQVLTQTWGKFEAPAR
jgi:hypothetical protein